MEGSRGSASAEKSALKTESRSIESQSTDGPRLPTESEWSAVVDFLNKNLRPSSSWSILAEYPSSLNRFQRHNMRVIFDQGEVVAHAVMKPIIVKTPMGVFKVAGIGSVVTDEKYRNQGHSRRILESCLEAARAADCDLAILWTDLFDFYRRLGFELAGAEVSILIDRDLYPPKAEAGTNYRFLDTDKIAADAILRLFQQHSVASHRAVEDVRASLAIPNSRVSTAWDSAGKLVAYAVEGKGADLDGYIHEWGGSNSALLALLSHMRSNQKRDLRIIAPAHSQNLISSLEAAGCSVHRGYLGMMKVLKTNSIFTKILRHSKSLGISDLVLEESAGGFKFGRGQNVYSANSTSDLVKLLFGPESPSSMHSFDPATAEALDQVLPLDLWIWGWDSV